MFLSAYFKKSSFVLNFSLYIKSNKFILTAFYLFQSLSICEAMTMKSAEFDELNKFWLLLIKLIKLYRNAHCCFENSVTYYFKTLALSLTILLTSLLSSSMLLNILLKKIRWFENKFDFEIFFALLNWSMLKLSNIFN